MGPLPIVIDANICRAYAVVRPGERCGQSGQQLFRLRKEGGNHRRSHWKFCQIPAVQDSTGADHSLYTLFLENGDARFPQPYD